MIAVLPALTALAGVGIAEAAGCKVAAAVAQSCILFGHEAKDVIYALSMSYWLLMFTALYVPIAMGLFFVAFITRGKQADPNVLPTNTGLLFWLTSIGLLISPLFVYFGFFLLIIAALLYAVMHWREQAAAKRSTPPDAQS